MCVYSYIFLFRAFGVVGNNYIQYSRGILVSSATLIWNCDSVTLSDDSYPSKVSKAGSYLCYFLHLVLGACAM